MTRRRRPPSRRWPRLAAVAAAGLLAGAAVALAGAQHSAGPHTPVQPLVTASDNIPHGSPSWSIPPAPSRTPTAVGSPTHRAAPVRRRSPRPAATHHTFAAAPTPAATPSATPPSRTSPATTPRPKPSPTSVAPDPPAAPATSPTTSSAASTGTGGRMNVNEPTTTWYTSATAVAAAQRMAASAVVGDPVCTLASVGQPDPSQIPTGVSSVGIGSSGGYWCLIW